MVLLTEEVQVEREMEIGIRNDNAKGIGSEKRKKKMRRKEIYGD